MLLYCVASISSLSFVDGVVEVTIGVLSWEALSILALFKISSTYFFCISMIPVMV